MFHERLRNAFVALLLVALTMAGCKKDDHDSGNTETGYEQLGDVNVMELTGFRLDGSPMARAENGDPVYWQQSSKTWQRITPALGGLQFPLKPSCEDAAGNIYAVTADNKTFILPAGTTAWRNFELPDSDPRVANHNDLPLANSRGDVVALTLRHAANADVHRLYRKNAGSTVWTLAGEWPYANRALSRLAENGDAYLAFVSGGQQEPLAVVKAGSTRLTLVPDCGGSTVISYCTYWSAVSPNSNVVLYDRAQSPKMYNMPAGAAYPGTAAEYGTLPGRAGHTVNFGISELLDNGTLIGIGNDNEHPGNRIFIFRKGSSGWYEAPVLTGGPYTGVKANAKGELYGYSDAGISNTGAPVFRISIQ